MFKISFIMAITCLSSFPLFANKPTNLSVNPLTPYTAQYQVLRSNSNHGTAQRQLTFKDNHYHLSYQSQIKLLIFSDRRHESSQFVLDEGKIKPLQYTMERKGTGPDRAYHIGFDHDQQQLNLKNKKQDQSSALAWNDDWLDPISYQQQLSIDLQKGIKEFHYELINRKGQPHVYRFKLTATETLTLPYGTMDTLKVERIYSNQDRQSIAWFAPELNYLLVRVWKSKSGKEQFDLKLKSWQTSDK